MAVLLMFHDSNASFEPGGWLGEPPRSAEPLLNVQVYPRMNLYTEDDQFASFIVDAALSHTNGEAIYPSTFDKSTNATTPFSHLYIDISVSDNGLALVSNSNVSINSTGNEFSFSLGKLKAQYDPYNITLVSASRDGNQSYLATTQLYKLPARTDGGSVAKLDKLYGGIYTQDYLTNSTAWTAIMPYSFYVSWDGWLENSLVNNTHTFKNYGYNIIHVVPNAGLANQAFNFTEFDAFLDICDELQLWVMYDMRWTYKNLTSVTEQVNRVKSRKSLLLWYTGDEPDGASDTLNATKDTYDTIKQLDPYHPVSLCLNCYNFHYANYSAGADIILSDVYPIAVNTSFSTQYGTACNTTYGCCGCDDCAGDFEDVSDRLDVFRQYQSWLGQEPKAFWGVPQAFGNETFWSRYPTADEEAVMAALSVNHGAKGIVGWAWPTQPHLADVTSGLARVLAAGDVAECLLGAKTTALGVEGRDRVDAAAWVLPGADKMLVSIVSLEYVETSENVTVKLPALASGVKSVEWGPGEWTVSGSTLWKKGMTGLEVDLLVLDLE
ncbi:glycoside hydrolase subgroup catalytic core [Diplodia corticola]|uniref:Glycoside hydrolase subgroup catalytic core n=1 Tax=Diplodia corticola TaxID=236234 RepID=A0A1J9QL36_9PEZI|nr:glycoside hydrolase subgroup catalytic core [Diplodia corticola]OJD28778.1 glycoside hydrolase subgroup catalytic core [Diplodia corticola]